MHVRVLHKSFFQMICSYFNIAFLINQPSVDISKPILLRSTIPRIALANVELFLFIFTTVFVTKSFLHPPRTPPVLPHPRRGRGSAPTLPRPLKPKCSLPPHFTSFSLAVPERGTPRPPLKGEAAQQRRRGQQRYAEYHFRSTKANSHKLLAAPPLGVVRRAANQDINDCRWQSCLCLVPQSGKGGVVGIFLSRHHSTNRTPSATRQEPPDGGCSLAWRLRAHKSALTG